MHNNDLKPMDARDQYLAAIYLLSKKLKHVRSIDIATFRNVSKAAVSMRIRDMKNEGLIRIDSNRITLTRKGQSIAERISCSYLLFKTFLTNSGVCDENAEEIASVSAGYINLETIDVLKGLIAEVSSPVECDDKSNYSCWEMSS